MVYILLGIALWFLCGLVTCWLSVNVLDKQDLDLKHALGMLLFGAFGLLVEIIFIVYYKTNISKLFSKTVWKYKERNKGK